MCNVKIPGNGEEKQEVKNFPANPKKSYSFLQAPKNCQHHTWDLLKPGSHSGREIIKAEEKINVRIMFFLMQYFYSVLRALMSLY